MIVRYTPCPVTSHVPGTAGKLVIPRPLLAVQISGPAGSSLRDGLLDTGADQTTLSPLIAPVIGIDLALLPERVIHLIGRGTIRCRSASVKLRITDGITETYEWDALVAFAPFPLPRNLLGFAGFLQFFDANFPGEAEEVVLFPNTAFAGQII